MITSSRLRTSIEKVTKIHFEFMPGTDAAADVSREPVAVGLVEGMDQEIAASHLQKITQKKKI